MSDPLVPFRRAADPDAVGRLLARAAPSMKTPTLGAEARARILAGLPEGPPPGPGAFAGTSWAKLAGVLATFAALVGGGVLVTSRNASTSDVVQPVPSASPPIGLAEPAALTSTEPVAPAPVLSVHDLPTALPSAPASASFNGAPVRTPEDTLAREVTLLDRARSVASSDPTAALALLDEHARTFPNGHLGPEREVFAVEALLAAGRRADAERRAATFVAAHPSSPHAARLTKLLER